MHHDQTPPKADLPPAQRPQSVADGRHKDPVEHDLALLINLTGKLRMLSHQIIMCKLLHAAPISRSEDDSNTALGFDQRLKTARKEFSRISDVLRAPEHDSALSKQTVALMIERALVTEEMVALLQTFLHKTAALDHADENDLAALGAFVADELLAGLNALIERISGALDSHAAQKNAEQEPIMKAATRSLAEIDRLAKTLQIVSMNASLEANRAGDDGAAFGTIAREMRDIGAKSLAEAQRMRGDLSLYQKGIGGT